MLGHILGVPVEETVVQLVPVGAVTVTAFVIAGRGLLARLRRR